MKISPWRRMSLFGDRDEKKQQAQEQQRQEQWRPWRRRRIGNRKLNSTEGLGDKCPWVNR
jgi:hypothetical protein